jgi:hypothetical protein
MFKKSAVERPSPSDIVPRKSIEFYETLGHVVIDISRLNIPFTKPPKVWIPEIPDTNSMDGTFDYGHNNILIKGTNSKNQRIMRDFLKAGDVAVYRIMQNWQDKPTDFSKPHRFYAIHRIVEISEDANGRFFRFKGDNNASPDPFRVYDDNILYLSIGTIY